ncbi:DUF1064 domain-containing protein [Petrachloros mirabilis]
MDYAKELRKYGLDDKQIAASTIDGKPLHEATAKKKQYRYGQFKSKWEAQYAAELDFQLRAGEILQWEYEPWSMKLTEPRIVNGKTQPGVRYTPDFVLWLPDKRIRCVEVKGYEREAAIARYKMAVEKYPLFEWEMVEKKQGGWTVIR